MEQDWLLYSITLFTFGVIFLFCYIRHVFTYFERNNIVCVSDPVFPFGNVYEVAIQETPLFIKLWKYFNKIKQRNHKFGGFYIFVKPAVLVVDKELTKSVLLTNSAFFQSPGHEKKLDPGLLKSLDEIIGNYSKSFQESWHIINENCDNNEIDFKHYFNRQILEFCSEKLFDVKLSESDYQSLEKIVTKPSFLTTCKNLLYLNDPTHEKTLRNFKTSLKHIFNSKTDELVEIFFKVFGLLSHSHSLTLMALFEIIHSSKIEETLRKELAINDSNYVEAVICETFRKYPPKPFVYRVCIKRFKANEEVTFEENLPVFVSIFGIQHDPQNYLNPERFDPKRFLNNCKLLLDDSRFLPFGLDAATEWSIQYVRVMKTILKEIVLSSHLSSASKTPKLLRFDEALFELRPKDPMWLKINKIN